MATFVIRSLIHRVQLEGASKAVSELNKVDKALKKTEKSAKEASKSSEKFFKDNSGRWRWKGGSTGGRGGQFVTPAELRAAGMPARGQGGFLSRLLSGVSGKGSADLRGSLDQMKSSISDITSMTYRMAAAFTVSGLGVGFLLKQMSDFEQVEIAFETMLGSAELAQKTLADLQNFARRTPFNFPQVADLSKRLLAFSFTAEELIPTMNDLGNIAAGVGREKLPYLVLALGQVRTAGVLRGQELRQFTEAGVPLIEELAKSTGRAKTEIQGMIQTGQISYDMVRESIANLSLEGGRFHNLMIKQSASLGGLFANTVDYLQMLVIKVGKRGLLKEAKSYVSGLIDVLETNEEQILNRTDQIIRSIIKGMRGVTNLVKAAGHVFRGFASIVGGTGNAINLLIISLTALAGARMLSMLGNFTAGLIGAARALLMLQGTAMLIPLAIGAAVAAIGLLVEDVIGYFQGRNSMTGLLIDNFDKISSHIINRAESLADTLKSKSSGIVEAIASFMEENAPKMGEILGKWFDVGIVVSGVAAKIGWAIASGFTSGMWSYISGDSGGQAGDGSGESEGFFDRAKGMLGKAHNIASLHPLMRLRNFGIESIAGMFGDTSFGALSPNQFLPSMAGAGMGGLSVGQVTNNITIPSGTSPEQAQGIVARGIEQGIADAQLRRAQSALQSP